MIFSSLLTPTAIFSPLSVSDSSSLSPGADAPQAHQLAVATNSGVLPYFCPRPESTTLCGALPTTRPQTFLCLSYQPFRLPPICPITMSILQQHHPRSRFHIHQRWKIGLLTRGSKSLSASPATSFLSNQNLWYAVVLGGRWFLIPLANA